MGTDDEIATFMRDVLDEYKQLRGKSKNSCNKPFWDVVVITTADKAQKEAFQLQIDEKFRRNELPIDLIIHVVTDPPGVRIVLKDLSDLHGERRVRGNLAARRGTCTGVRGQAVEA